MSEKFEGLFFGHFVVNLIEVFQAEGSDPPIYIIKLIDFNLEFLVKR